MWLRWLRHLPCLHQNESVLRPCAIVSSMLWPPQARMLARAACRLVHSLAPLHPHEPVSRAARACRHIWLAKDAPTLFPFVVGLLFLGYVLMVLWARKIVALLDRAIKDYRRRHANGGADGDAEDDDKED